MAGLSATGSQQLREVYMSADIIDLAVERRKRQGTENDPLVLIWDELTETLNALNKLGIRVPPNPDKPAA
jgi:hypothetical protein